MWCSNEDTTKDSSHDDLYTSQNYMHAMNYSESENDFQTLKLDETLFENPSSRSRSEAQLPNVAFSKTGLQAKAKKLDDLSNEKVIELYDLHTPRNSPRWNKNKVSCSTGDLASEPPPSLSARNLKPALKQKESPLVGQQQEQTVTVTIEETNDTTDSKQTDDVTDSQQIATSNEDQPIESHKWAHNADQTKPALVPSVEISSLQEDNTSCISNESLRTVTPDSGVAMNEESTSNSISQSVKPENTSNVNTSNVVTDSRSDTLSTNSSTQDTATAANIITTNPIVNNTTPIIAPDPVVNDTPLWETVADRRKRYLQIIEHSKLKKLPPKDNQTSSMGSCSFTQVEVDSDYGNSGDESTTILSSSQPMLNLTNPEDSKSSLRDDSSSDSEVEEMQSPLVLIKRSLHNTVTLTTYTNPLLSDSSSDEECEMVQPGEAVVYQSLVKNANQDARQIRSHPPLQRTQEYEQAITSVTQHSKKRQHKPILKSIIEEDGNINVRCTNVL